MTFFSIQRWSGFIPSLSIPCNPNTLLKIPLGEPENPVDPSPFYRAALPLTPSYKGRFVTQAWSLAPAQALAVLFLIKKCVRAFALHSFVAMLPDFKDCKSCPVWWKFFFRRESWEPSPFPVFRLVMGQLIGLEGIARRYFDITFSLDGRRLNIARRYLDITFLRDDRRLNIARTILAWLLAFFGNSACRFPSLILI